MILTSDKMIILSVACVCKHHSFQFQLVGIIYFTKVPFMFLLVASSSYKILFESGIIASTAKESGFTWLSALCTYKTNIINFHQLIWRIYSSCKGIWFHQLFITNFKVLTTIFKQFITPKPLQWVPVDYQYLLRWLFVRWARLI